MNLPGRNHPRKAPCASSSLYSIGLSTEHSCARIDTSQYRSSCSTNCCLSLCLKQLNNMLLHQSWIRLELPRIPQGQPETPPNVLVIPSSQSGLSIKHSEQVIIIHKACLSQLVVERGNVSLLVSVSYLEHLSMSSPQLNYCQTD